MPVSLLVVVGAAAARAPPGPRLGQRRDLRLHARRVRALLLHAEGRAGAGALRAVPAEGAARSTSRSRDGLAVEVRATPTIYEARGEFQLNVETVRLAGLGALYERFARLKARLEAAGWFAAERKRALPAFPRARRHRHVAARRGAARRADDARAPLARRCASSSIRRRCRATAPRPRSPRRSRAANARAEVDVLIVCRGGGSIEDLWAFNEEVGRARGVRVGAAGRLRRRPRDRLHDLRFRRRRARADADRARRRWSCRTARRCAAQAQAGSRALAARARRARCELRVQRLDQASRRLVHPAARLARAARARSARWRERLRARGCARRTDARQRRCAGRGRLARELARRCRSAHELDATPRALARARRASASQRPRDAHRRAARRASRTSIRGACSTRGYAIVTDGRRRDRAGRARSSPIGDSASALRVRARRSRAAKVTRTRRRADSDRRPASGLVRIRIVDRARRACSLRDHVRRRLRRDLRRRGDARRRSARDGAARGPSAPAPASPRRSASRGCRRRDRGGRAC